MNDVYNTLFFSGFLTGAVCTVCFLAILGFIHEMFVEWRDRRAERQWQLEAMELENKNQESGMTLEEIRAQYAE